VWTVVYIAPNKREADKLEKRLTVEGFLVKLRANKREADKLEKRLTVEGFLVKLRAIGPQQAGNTCSIEILVPESEVDEALEIINSI